MQSFARAACMYSQIPIDDVNELRYRLFCSRSAQSTSLPPTRDALVLHVRRANYQAAVWRRALSNTFQPPSPHGHGWVVKNTELKVEWMTQPAAPAALLELRKCGCATGCASQRCSCRASLYLSALMHASARTAQTVQKVSMRMTRSLPYLVQTLKLLLLSKSIHRRAPSSEFCMSTLGSVSRIICLYP